MKITTITERDITPRELAVAFWEMRPVDQAEFLNELFEVAGENNLTWAVELLRNGLRLGGKRAVQILATALDEHNEQ